MKIAKLCMASLLVVLMASFVFAQAGLTREEIEQQISANLDKIDLSQAPKALKFLLGKPKMNIVIANLDGTESTYGFKIGGNKITDFKAGGLEKPHYIITISEESILEIAFAEDPGAKATELYLSEEIAVKPQTLGSKIKYWFVSKIMNRFLK